MKRRRGRKGEKEGERERGRGREREGEKEVNRGRRGKRRKALTPQVLPYQPFSKVLDFLFKNVSRSSSR